MSVNKVILVGRLGKDPELRYTPNGQAVCNFPLATSESWRDKNTGERQERTEWHRIVVWGKGAEICNQYLGKGKQVYIEGKLQTRSWEANDGGKRYSTEILATNFTFLGQAQDGGASRSVPGRQMADRGVEDHLPHGPGGSAMGQEGQSAPPLPEDNFGPDDIPF